MGYPALYSGAYPPMPANPVVIGTLTSTTVQNSYTVPITVATNTSDAISVFSASNTPSAGAPSVTNVTDSKGNQYVLVTQTTANQIVSEWRAWDAVALTTSDTVTVTFGSATGNLKDIMVVDLPGVSTWPSVDSATTINNFANNSNPNISIPAGSQAVELQLVACVTSNTQGVPTSGFGPFTTFTSLHSGSAEWLTVGYLITTSPQAQTLTFNVGGVAGQWGVIASGTFLNTQPEYVQQAFPTGQLPVQLAFNPAYSTQLRWNPGQLGTAVTLPISFAGSQTNVIKGVNTNLHLGDASTFEATVGSWSGGTGMNVSRVFSQAHSGSFSLKLNPTSTGSRAFLSSTVANLPVNGIRVNPGDTVFIGFWVMADPAFAGEVFNAGVDFYDVNTNQIGGTTSGSSFTDVVNSWTFVYVETTAPANAYWARAHHLVNSTAIGNLHYVDDMVFYDLSTSSSPGIPTIYTQQFQTFQLSPNGLPYPLYLNNASLQYPPRQIGTVNALANIQGQIGTVAVTAPAGNVNISQPFFAQYPFPQIIPLSIQISPSLSWLMPQHSTANKPTFIDGGSGGQVAVNAQFADQAVTVSVSATVNVGVIAYPPQGNVNGPAANVNVVAQNGNIVEALAGTVSTVSVAAIAGSTTVSPQGTAANANVAVPSGQTVKVSPAGVAANVNVAMAGDNVIVVQMGTTVNISVASTEGLTISPQGVAANVNATAIAGGFAYSVTGTAATVNVASTASTSDTITGTVANASAAALAGSIAKGVSGITATVIASTTPSAQITFFGVGTNVTATAIPGNVNRTLTGTTAKVSVAGFSGQDGTITISGTLVNPDLAEDRLLSDQGKLLDIPVRNMLVSATS